MKKKLSKSRKKFIRIQKSLIRREVSDLNKRKELIKKLYEQ